MAEPATGDRPSIAPVPPPPLPPIGRGVETDASLFDPAPPFRPRRNPARRMTMLAIAFALVAGIAAAALFWLAPPQGLMPFAKNAPELEIILDRNQDRQTLADGTQYFAASGTIVNPTDRDLPVPPLLVVLKDAQGRVVYSWTMAPPRAKLAPGARVPFNQAKLDVPRAADMLEVGWADAGQ